MLRQVRIKRVNNVDILIISTKYDFSTDYICVELYEKKQSYLRINRDEFEQYKVVFNINNEELEIKIDSKIYIINNNLKSVYYRAPTYFRETYLKEFSTEEQLYNSQWMSFIRNLTFFENARWINNPNDTFKAENKLLQLKYARKVGFLIPETIVTNDNDYTFESKKAIKSLDTAIFTIKDQEAFLYTNILSYNEYKEYDVSLCPIVIQENLHPKIDYRVTVIGEKVYAVKIVANNKGIDGDWRKQKENIFFEPVILPKDVKIKCIEILKKFNLLFGGIDLIYYKNNYYFIEVNPTGEWAWLVDNAKQEINKGICEYLI